MNADQFMEYLHENFDISGAAGRLIRNILDYAGAYIERNRQYHFFCEVLDGTIGLSDREIHMISL